MPIRTYALLILGILSLLCSGCIKPLLPHRLSVNLAQLNTDFLKDKIIVIDPGHGGEERGAIGAQGMQEAEVNLGVALYLWGFLKNAGAHPVLTRTTDTRVSRDDSFVLKQELQARSDVSNACKADLFISIHHNSDINTKARNDLIIFYKMSDPGQSKDVARDICNALKERLHPKTATAQPGNYHVLRGTDAPAILGEASFMSNKKNETMLSYHRTLTAEAAGYFFGILAYYQKGVPFISDVSPRDVTLTATQPALSFTAHPGSDNGSIDASSVAVTLDGKTVKDFTSDGKGVFTFVPKTPLPNGNHQLCAVVRNVSGNISKKACASFTVALPALSITMTPVFPVIPADGFASTPVAIEVLDGLKKPVTDDTEVKLSSTGGSLSASSVVTKAGRARVVLTSHAKQQEVTITATTGEATARCSVRIGAPEGALLLVTIKDTKGNPVDKGALMRAGREVAVSDSEGVVCDSVQSSGTMTYTFVKKGYQPCNFKIDLATGRLSTGAVEIRQVDDGVFFNRTVMLDPTGSKVESLTILTALKEKIERAGGRAVLTWKEPPAPADNKKALQAGAEKADIFLSVARAGKTASVRYYYKSEDGEGLARHITRMLSDDKLCCKKECTADAATDYILIHTAMPAVCVRMPEKLRAPAMEIADSLYKALREFFKK